MTVMIAPKLDGWQDRLDRLVAQATRKPFVWGSHDCGLWAASAVEAQTGVDFAAGFRGRYDSFEAALKLLRAAGYEDHVALAAAHLPEIPVAFARVGDIAAVDFESAGMTLTVVAGHRLIGPMPAMRGNMPLTSACRAFAVGWAP